MGVEGDKGKTKFVELVADVHQQVLDLLVHVAPDAVLFAELVEGRLDDL